jgi:hypothetical protein
LVGLADHRDGHPASRARRDRGVDGVSGFTPGRGRDVLSVAVTARTDLQNAPASSTSTGNPRLATCDRNMSTCDPRPGP